MSLPSWHQWISYETKFLDKELIVELIIDSLEHSINLREMYGLYSRSEAETERLCFVEANKLVIKVVNKAMSLHDEGERLDRLRVLKEYLNGNIPHLENV
jgi:hypothetical protein